MLKVFHLPQDLAFCHRVDLAAAYWHEGRYTQVAEVELPEDIADDTEALEHAYERTNSVLAYWGLNRGVKVIGERNRSTSIGDVVELNGVPYFVATFGFRKLLACDGSGPDTA